jgi:hypothetical protein
LIPKNQSPQNWDKIRIWKQKAFKVVEAPGIEPGSLVNKPAATTCLFREMFSAM